MDHLLVELKSIEEGSGGSLVGEVLMQAGGHTFWIPSTYIKKKNKQVLRCGDPGGSLQSSPGERKVE